MDLNISVSDIIIAIFFLGFLSIIIFEKQIRKLIENQKVALIVIDMQNDFLENGCFFDKMNKSMQYGREIIPNINKITQQFRDKNMPVIFIHSLYGECKEKELSPDYIKPVDLKYRSKNVPLNDIIRSGTHKQEQITCCAKDDVYGRQLYKEIEKKDGDIMIQKEYYSSFRKSELQKYLKDNFIGNLIITGVATNYCVTATVIDGFHLGYDILLVEDGVAASKKEYHDKALESLKEYYCELKKTNEIIKLINENY